MLNLEACKKILSKNKYTDEQIKQIRDVFYQLGKYQLIIDNNRQKNTEL